MLRNPTLLILLVISFSCSQFSNNKTSVKFHDVNSKYNALWQAKRIEKEMLLDIEKNQKENYSFEVSIARNLDSNLFKKYKTQIDSIVYKSSLIIQRHANSKYLDDAYFMIGKARIYQGDYKNAIQTFKYVNSISEDSELQLNALIQLYQLYKKLEENREAERIKEFILEFEMKDYQKRDYFLLLANQYQNNGNSEATIQLLKEVINSTKEKEEKARIHFILAQIYYLNGLKKQAQDELMHVLKLSHDPDKLLEARLTYFQLKEDIPALEKYLKEEKYRDKKGKIYATIGQIYANQGSYDLAEKAWTKATSYDQNKGQIFYQIAEAQSKILGNYPKAIVHYDSAAAYVPSTAKNYIQVLESKRQWTEFGKLWNNYHLEDSLLQLANKSEEDLQLIYQNQTKVDSSKLERKSTEKPKSQLIIFTRRPPSAQQQSFYFYNDPLRIQGGINFNQKYGDRVLEDFWNRKYKVGQSFATKNAEEDMLALPDISRDQGTEKPILKEEKLTNSTVSFENWAKNIPKTPEEMLEIQKKKENSLYNLGKYSWENLKLANLAIKYLEELLALNPSSAYAPEVYYILYKLNPKENSQYFELLKLNFPDSHFLALIHREESGTLADSKEIQAQKMYEEALEKYSAGKYQESFSQCLILEKDYANSKFEDRVLYLKALNKYALKDKDQAKMIIQNLLKLYPNTLLKFKAENLLKKLNE